MSADDLNVKIESTEINITVEDLPDLNIDSSPDVIVLMATPIGPQGIPGVSGLPEDIVVPNGTRILTNKFVAADSQPAFRLMASGRLEFGAGGSTPVDTFLYRSAAGQLKTDGGFSAGGPYYMTGSPGGQGGGVRYLGGAGGATSWYMNAATAGVIYFAINETVVASVASNAFDLKQVLTFQNDTNLYRSGAGVLKTDSFFNVQNAFLVQYGRVKIRAGLLEEINIGDRAGDGTTPYISFGSAGDTNLYRSATSSLKTDSSFYVAGHTILDANQTGAKLYFTGNFDTVLYRSAANQLRTGGTFLIDGWFDCQNNTTTQMIFGDLSLFIGGASRSGILFGSANDTNLYRFSAGVLQTDGEMRIVRNLVVAANIYSQPASNGTGFLYNPQQPGGTAFYSITQGESNPRFYFSDNGSMWWGAGGSSPIDVNLYRPTAGQLRTNALFIAQGQIYSQAAGNGGGFVYNPASGGGTAFNSTVQGLANPYFYIDASGTMNWGPGSTPTDTRLYRYSGSILGTDGDIEFRAGSNYRGRLGYIGAVDAMGLQLGSTYDTYLYRKIWAPIGAPTLQTNGSFIANGTVAGGGGNYWAGILNPNQAGSPYTFFGMYYDSANNRGSIGALSGGVAWRDVLVGESGRLLVNKIMFGTSNTNFDVDLYRVAANNLATNGAFTAGTIIVIGESYSSSAKWFIDGGGKHQWGPGDWSRDTNLYRSASGQLKTDGQFVAISDIISTTSNVWSNYNTAKQVKIGDFNGLPGIMFGSGLPNGDTNLYRSGAGVLKTDGIINAVGGLQINGVPVGTGGGTGPKITTSPISGGPPASPANGDIWYATGVGTSGDRWAFQYNASSGSAYKWEFIGGAPLRAYIQAFQGGTTGVAWVDYGGPSVVWPRAGEMIIEFGAHFDVFQETGMIVVMADGNIVTDQIQSTTPVAASSRIASSMMTPGVIWGPATLKIMYQATGTADWGQRWIKVTPVRIA